MKASELKDKIDALSEQLEKSNAEIIQEVQTLKDELADAEIPTAATESLERLGTLVQALDDRNPDSTPEAKSAKKKK